ncbi:hypothetical protein HYX12_03995 [Candidatus Woesearchaeota archaeon]|nr:hypothetical protein [Candidatus Woesearchaeota archaeon]
MKPLENLANFGRLGLALVSLYAAGCAGTKQEEKALLSPSEQTSVYSCPEYRVQVGAETNIRVIAALAAGFNVAKEVPDEPGQYVALPRKAFSEVAFPGIMNQACVYADTNGDGVILEEEARKAAFRATKFFAERDKGKQ